MDTLLCMVEWSGQGAQLSAESKFVACWTMTLLLSLSLWATGQAGERPARLYARHGPLPSFTGGFRVS